MPQVNVKVKDIITIHTSSGGRLDQPMIEVMLEVNKVGETEKYEIKFSEMLSNLASMTPSDLQVYVQKIVEAYVETAYKGQQTLDPGTGDWEKQAQYIGKEFTVEI